MTIEYQNESSFYDGIYSLVLKGLTFQADGEKLTIKLTGGY